MGAINRKNTVMNGAVSTGATVLLKAPPGAQGGCGPSTLVLDAIHGHVTCATTSVSATFQLALIDDLSQTVWFRRFACDTNAGRPVTFEVLWDMAQGPRLDATTPVFQLSSVNSAGFNSYNIDVSYHFE